ncbi:glycosyltransferase family 4 protein [Ammoniphilus sp. 3BR4]|uniref:glycosyltransferase family 4 protein n=1 Tax=Ammoniphilus sp. 3BR4 TaxID=3158265 RepID=UPI0034677A63
MKILVIWKLLTVGGVNAGWRNRAIHFSQNGVTTDFLYLHDKGGLHMLQDVARIYLTQDPNQIIKILKKNRYDLIVVVDSSEVYPLIKKAKFNGKLIIEARSPDKEKIAPHLQDFKGLNPDAIVVPSIYQKRVVTSILNKRVPIRIIYNPIDTDSFKPILSGREMERADALMPQNKKIIGWIGRLDVRKNWRFLLEIARHMVQIRKDIQFWVIGGKASRERDLFSKQIKEYKLKDYVRWFPVVPYQKMPMIYSQIAHSGGCTLSTTLMESFGNTFIESMACGCPVVAPGVSSLPELIEHDRTGKLYRPASLMKALKHLNNMLNNHQLREEIRKNALNEVKTRFAIEVCAEQYLQILRDMVGEASNRTDSRAIATDDKVLRANDLHVQPEQMVEPDKNIVRSTGQIKYQQAPIIHNTYHRIEKRFGRTEPFHSKRHFL